MKQNVVKAIKGEWMHDDSIKLVDGRGFIDLTKGINIADIDAVSEYIVDQLERNGFKETPFVTPDGCYGEITPCGYFDLNSVKDCDWFLVGWDMPWGGQPTIEKLARELVSHAELVNDQLEDEKQLRAYFLKHEEEGWDDDSYSFYSDWHKDVYGYRPRF